MCGQLAYLPRDSFVMVYLSVMFFPVHTLAANFCAAQRTLRHVRAHERVCGHEPGTLDYRGIEGHSVRTGHDGMAAGRSASQPLQVKFALLQARPHRLTAHCVAAFRLPLAPQAASPATRPRPGSVTDSVTGGRKTSAKLASCNATGRSPHPQTQARIASSPACALFCRNSY